MSEKKIMKKNEFKDMSNFYVEKYEFSSEYTVSLCKKEKDGIRFKIMDNEKGIDVIIPVFNIALEFVDNCAERISEMLDIETTEKVKAVTNEVFDKILDAIRVKC